MQTHARMVAFARARMLARATNAAGRRRGAATTRNFKLRGILPVHAVNCSLMVGRATTDAAMSVGSRADFRCTSPRADGRLALVFGHLSSTLCSLSVTTASAESSQGDQPVRYPADHWIQETPASAGA